MENIYLNARNLTTNEAESILETISDEDKNNVIILWLQENNLEYIPETVKLFTNIEVLILNNNRIRQFPSWIGDLTALEVLIINNNFLSDIPHSIGNLTNLEILNCANNKIEALPAALTQLTKLDSIYLSDNYFGRRFGVEITHNHTEVQRFFQMINLEAAKCRMHRAGQP